MIVSSSSKGCIESEMEQQHRYEYAWQASSNVTGQEEHAVVT